MKQKDSFWVWTAVAGVALVALAFGLYYLYRSGQPVEIEPVAVQPPALTPPPPRAAGVAAPPPELAEPLPALDASDSEVQSELTEVFGPAAVQRFLTPERIVRRIVVTIDNVTREKMALQQRPVKPTQGDLLTSGADDTLVLAPENYARYTPIVTAIDALDAGTLVALYRRLQPLFQQSYEELGNPNGFFNTRLLEVIDHLISTPVVAEPIRLAQPGVFYTFADEELEELSSGQKLLIRMGPDNAAIIKAKLREIQAEMI